MALVNRILIKEGPYEMYPYMQLDNFIRMEINAFCSKRKFQKQNKMKKLDRQLAMSALVGNQLINFQ